MYNLVGKIRLNFDRGFSNKYKNPQLKTGFFVFIPVNHFENKVALSSLFRGTVNKRHFLLYLKDFLESLSEKQYLEARGSEFNIEGVVSMVLGTGNKNRNQYVLPFAI
jgi:hypothetical protein